MFRPISELVVREINKAGLSGEVKALAVISEYKKVVREMIKDEAVENLVPKFFKEGALHIEAKSAGWSQNLHMKQYQIIDKINTALDGDLVQKFIIKIVG